MSHHRALRGSGLVAIAALVAFACGGGGGGGGGAEKGTILIGVDLPQSGAEASNGIPTLNGVKYFVQKNPTVKGFKLDVLNFDDAVNGVHDPQKGAQNVSQMLANKDVLGMVGPFNSNVARAEIPIANAAGLTMVSPANTNECLTQDLSGCDPGPAKLRPSGKPNNYYRVAATDNRQGPALADYAFDTLKLTKLAVGSDNETYGKGIADNFAKEFKKKGGTVVVQQDIDTKSTSDFRSFLAAAKNGGATGIYFGGTDTTKSCIVRSQMKGIFDASTPFMGGDGIVTAQCLDDAADTAPGMYGTVAAVDAPNVPDAKTTIDGYKKAFTGTNDFGAYTVPAYAAAQALVQAMGIAIDANGGNKPSREQVRDAMGKIKNLATPIGTISFDKNGDIIPQIITIYLTKASVSDKQAADSPGCGTKVKTTCFIFEKSINYTG